MVRLTEPAARKLIRQILSEGRFVAPAAGSHARIEMDKDELTDVDLVNVLYGGTVMPAEYENGEWRHRVGTPRIVVVITFEPEPGFETKIDPETELFVVTAWRIKR